MAPTAKFTRQQVAARNHRQDAAIIIDNVVYDVTEFLFYHPGGDLVLLEMAGKDASECFHEVRHSDVAYDWRKEFVAGEVVDEDRWEVRTRAATPPPQLVEQRLSWGALLSVWGLPVVVAVLLCYYLLP